MEGEAEMGSSQERAVLRMRRLTRTLGLSVLLGGLLLGIGACDVTEPEPEGGVTIADPFLEAVIRDMIDRPEGVLTPADLQGIRRLEVEGSSFEKVTRLEGIEHLTNLEVLHLRGNEIQDLFPLSDLDRLETLGLQGNRVQDLSPIARIPGLRHLLLDGNPLQDLTGTGELPHLRWLTARNTEVSGLDVLEGHSSLIYLDVGQTEVTDLSSLSGLSALRGLMLDGSQVTSLSPLSGLPELRTLEITGNGIEDAAPLLDLSSLELVGVGRNPWTDQALCQDFPSAEARGVVVVPSQSCPHDPSETDERMVTLNRPFFVASIDPSSPSNEASNVEVRMGFALENRTGGSLFLPECEVLHPPLIERQVSERWEVAFQPTFLLCGGEREVSLGESAGRAWKVIGEDTEGRTLLEDADTGPGRISGPFRLDWNAWRDEFGASLSQEERRSDPFFIWVPPL